MTTEEKISGWFAGRIPGDWFESAPEVRCDRDEIMVVGRLSEPKLDEQAGDDGRTVACSSRIAGFREDTRDQRIRVAAEAEHLFERKVSWACRCGDVEREFTVASVPVMTRLRFGERRVLDTLIEAGIARSRSEALAWCVKLVGQNQAEWIQSLRDALTAVEEVRSAGPTAT